MFSKEQLQVLYQRKIETIYELDAQIACIPFIANIEFFMKFKWLNT